MKNIFNNTFCLTAFVVSSFAMTAHAAVCQDKSCTTLEISIFDENDEKQAYNDYGYSRGDVKYLHTYKYDTTTEETVNGQILEVIRVQYPDNDCYLIAVVKANDEDILINLGPVWFHDENGFLISEGDTITVKGSRIRTNGRYIIIASELKKDDKTLKLRNANGTAEWGAPKAQKSGAYCDGRAVNPATRSAVNPQGRTVTPPNGTNTSKPLNPSKNY